MADTTPTTPAPAWDLTDETTLLVAFVTDGCGHLIMLDEHRREVARTAVTSDSTWMIVAAMKRLLGDASHL